MPFNDLREYIKHVESLGELRILENADCELEIGALTELAAQAGGPALLFDKIKDYPAGFRVVSNLFFSNKRFLSALGLPLHLTEAETVRAWKKILSEMRPVPPVVVKSGPVLENEMTGAEVDLKKFPAPRWHELDGGYYLGTGDVVIVRDPDTGWINLGVYRMMVHDSGSAGLFFQAVRHGFQIAEKYWKKGQGCPVAISFGQEPVVFMAAGVALGYVRDQLSEYDFAGYIRGEPLEVIEGKVTGLPFPATAEIVLEGEILPLDQQRLEGPFGEFTGYYGHKILPSPVVKVGAIYYRNDPILIGAPPMKPTFGNHFSMSLGVAHTWNRLESMGIDCVHDIRRVCGLSALAVSIRQRSEGDVPGVIRALSKLQNFHRVAILVDDDVDVDDAKDILWALGTRCEPKTGTFIETGWSREELDPMAPLECVEGRKPFETSRVIMNACKPFGKLSDFPKVNVFSKPYLRKISDKWLQKLDFLNRLG